MDLTLQEEKAKILEEIEQELHEHRKKILLKKQKEKPEKKIQTKEERQAESWRKSHKKSMNVKRKIVSDAKSVPCMDCGNRYPTCCMDFDHRDKTKKSFNIGASLSSKSYNEICDEIAKCDIVCSNCHRIRTQKILDKPLIFKH